MVFAEVEARAIANELAAQAKVGDFEPGFEAGGAKTARSADQEQEDLEVDVDADTQLEISLDPKEVISDVFTEDITAAPDESSLSLEKVQEAPPLPVEDAAPVEKLGVDDLVFELELVEAVPAESPAVEQPTPKPNPKSKSLSRTQSYCKNRHPFRNLLQGFWRYSRHPPQLRRFR